MRPARSRFCRGKVCDLFGMAHGTVATARVHGRWDRRMANRLRPCQQTGDRPTMTGDRSSEGDGGAKMPDPAKTKRPWPGWRRFLVRRRVGRRRYVPWTIRFLKYYWGFKLTPAGRYLFLGICFTAMGSVSVLIPVYHVFCSLLALYCVAWCVNMASRPRLDVEVHLPPRGVAGRELRGSVQLVNRGRRCARDVMLHATDLPSGVRLVDGDTAVARLRPGESVRLPLGLFFERRGAYTLPKLWAPTTFPFNLFRAGSSGAPLGQVLIVPAFEPLGTLAVPFGTRYQPGGNVQSLRVGESCEYIGNREYVPGEPARRLDFRSWARLAKPVVREYQEEYYSRVAVILDTHVPESALKSRKPLPQFEAAVSLTAAVADKLRDTDALVDFFAAGPDLYVFHAQRRTDFFDRMLEVLAVVGPHGGRPFQTLLPVLADHWERLSAAICILLDWDEDRRRLLERLATAGCDVKAVIVRSQKCHLSPSTHSPPGTWCVVSERDVLRCNVRHL